uniref:Uncharacterized protein n=1 Tax=Avena sativa TaxID=4498 RepID=A0ACD5Z9G5_AVESA
MISTVTKNKIHFVYEILERKTKTNARDGGETSLPIDLMPSRSLRVAVIGAGAAALVVARELRREGHAPVVFERTDGVGGIWVYDADASASADPLGSRPSNLYASLRTNLPRECMGFLDFPFAAAAAAGPDDDPRRFPGHAEVLRYLRDFARRFDLHGLVRFETEVVRVTREAAASWRVRYSSKLAGSEQCEAEEVFDAVVVCNGHYSQPHLADIPGMDAWPGEQLHSNSYRVPDPFHGQVRASIIVFLPYYGHACLGQYSRVGRWWW